MLIDEMHHSFELECNKVDSLASLDFLPVEKDAYINKGIWIFVKQRYDVDLSSKKRGFETDQTRIDNLRNLHIKSPELQAALVPNNISGNLYKVNLSGLTYEYWSLTRVRVDITSNSCTKQVRVKSFQTDDREGFFWKPDFDWGQVNMTLGKTGTSTNSNTEKGALFFDTQGAYTIDKVYIDYLKYPARVFFSGYNHLDGQSSSGDPKIHCDIDSAYHDEIIRIAVQEAHKDLGSTNQFNMSRLQTELDK